MQNLFENYNTTIIEKFEIIFDRANSEKVALDNSVDYYLTLYDNGIIPNIEEIVETAENYGYDFSEFKSRLQKEM